MTSFPVTFSNDDQEEAVVVRWGTTLEDAALKLQVIEVDWTCQELRNKFGQTLPRLLPLQGPTTVAVATVELESESSDSPAEEQS